MARTQDQTRWRRNSGKKRIEVYITEDTVTALDNLASERGLSRAGVIAQLVADRTAEADAKPEGKGYSLRKAKGNDSFDWLVIVNGEPIAGIERYEPIHGWRGKYLQASLTFKWAKGETRDAVAFDLIDAPYIYR